MEDTTSQDKVTELGVAWNTAFAQQWLNSCDAVIEWREVDDEWIEFVFDPSVEVASVPDGISFGADHAEEETA